MKIKQQLLSLACALACATNLVHAQDAPEVLESVSVNMKRDGSIRPYRQMNEVLSMVQRYGQGLFRLEFKLEAKDPKVQLPKVPKLAVMHADAYVPIAMQADGSFELPVLPKEQAQDAEIASNLVKGTAKMSGRLLLTIKSEQLDMAMVRKIVGTATSMRSEILPWYLRWAFPQAEGVRICSAQANWELEWPDPAANKANNTAGQLLSIALSAEPKQLDPHESGAAKKSASERRQCTTLTGQERWPDKARLLAPADASLSLRVSGES
ncbi:hypothetical protein LNV08_01250 [Paucibacter sp. TC2R-5]|uniref:hypothetical protein n=1 Tax=Paucibacter sp. TC2R-5 TaxID=2893555 RepID=UPI0021E4DAEC|nr:hypothetical protein [Paucibacter sp. TC2R-5]MCV2357595.1 hypothetical protein [Paucibacter sp. TC2R-5]